MCALVCLFRHFKTTQANASEPAKHCCQNCSMCLKIIGFYWTPLLSLNIPVLCWRRGFSDKTTMPKGSPRGRELDWINSDKGTTSISTYSCMWLAYLNVTDGRTTQECHNRALRSIGLLVVPLSPVQSVGKVKQKPKVVVVVVVVIITAVVW